MDELDPAGQGHEIGVKHLRCRGRRSADRHVLLGGPEGIEPDRLSKKDLVDELAVTLLVCVTWSGLTLAHEDESHLCTAFLVVNTD